MEIKRRKFQIKLMSDDERKRMIIACGTDLRQIIPAIDNEYGLLKESLHKHRLYRQFMIKRLIVSKITLSNHTLCVKKIPLNNH